MPLNDKPFHIVRESVGLYLPRYYKTLVETDAIIKAMDELFNYVHAAYYWALNNQYINSADEFGIERHEKMLGIIPNPATEDLEFRRLRVLNRLAMTPPFTATFLRGKLDEVLGVGQYKMYVGYGDGTGGADPYTLVVESAVDNFNWFEEILVTINKIKPANIVFRSKPLATNGALANETIQYNARTYNYGLGTTWDLGQKPFMSSEFAGVIKIAQSKSIADFAINEMAKTLMGQVTKARINGKVIVSELKKKIEKGEGGYLVIVEYLIPFAETKGDITKIELLSADDKPITSAAVFVPATDDIEMQHRLRVMEGVK